MYCKHIIYIIFLFLTFSLCSCSSQRLTPYIVVSQGTLRPGNPVPKPKNKIILTIKGKVSVFNQGNHLDFDMDTLESIGTVKYTVNDPFLKRQVEYTGVLLQDLLDVTGYSKDATTIHAIALNDYKVDIPLSVLRWPVMVATLRDGQRMLETDKGPAEIVFPNITFEHEMDAVEQNPWWDWQLRELTLQ